jgi:hypothetical protein
MIENRIKRKEKRIMCLFFLLSISISAQTKGVVKDSISGKPIPYVNIWVDNENIGTTSEENGTFTINTSDKSKNVILSVIGYETKKIAISDSENIILKPIVYQLEDVVISKLKNTKELEIDDSKKRFYLPEPQEIPWIFARKFQIIENNEELKYVKEITFFTKSEVDNGIFRARIYEVNDDGLPGIDLIADEIIVTTKKGEHKSKVNISKYKLQIPKEGIIVAFESLIVDQNKYYQQVISLKPKKKFKILNYAPHIMYFYNNSIEHYNFRLGKWIHVTKDYYEKYNGLYKTPVPAINITLTN